MNVDYYMKLSSQVLFEQNKVRSDPQSYIQLVKNQMKFLKGNFLQLPGEVPVYTFEGKKAYEEAIAYLTKRKPIDTLTFDENLSKASQDHVSDIGPTGSVDILSSNGDDLTTRIDRYCEWDRLSTESFNFGGKTAEDVIISLIVDDGFNKRPHRENLFNEELRFIGIASGFHREFKVVNVLTYTGEVREKGITKFSKDLVKYTYPKDINKGKLINLINKFKDQRDQEELDKAKQTNNMLSVNDKDAPEDSISVTITKNLKKSDNNKDIIVEKKLYKLKDNSTYIVEKEYF